MATYLEGVEDGRRDVLIRIEREAVAVYIDTAREQDRGRSPEAQYHRQKMDTLINLIRTLSLEPVSWSEVYDRVRDEALRKIEDRRVADAKPTTGQVSAEATYQAMKRIGKAR